MNRKLIKKTIFIVYIFLLFISHGFAQGLSEGDLTTNHVLVEKWKQNQSKPVSRDIMIVDTMDLDTIKGFLDDFSYDGVYPDTSLWLDNSVFINRGYGISPVSIGTATFDGLNANGYPYDFMASPTSSGAADTLTSKPINLYNYIHNGASVNYHPNDSLYLSFYYQPQGRGNSPESADSLVLEFTSPLIGSWVSVWNKGGYALPQHDSTWKLVMIPITDLAYLQYGFQFRFRNYATLCGNLDHWNVDYVYLNKFRTRTDTLFEDIAFVYNTPSMINTYSSMPWKHYVSEFMKPEYRTIMRNNFNIPKNGNFKYNIYDETGTQINTTYSGGSNNLDPFIQVGYINYTPFTQPPLNYTFPTMFDTTNYTIECILNSSPDKHRQNDTVRHRQEFLNYYAYDDGSAESAFYLTTLNGTMAVKYDANIADTLKCIDIYFNPIISNANNYAIQLNVWADAGNGPGTTLYASDTVLIPQYSQTGHDRFTHYYLDPPLFIPAGNFYIGFTQKTDQQLNVGVDRNNNSQDKVFYNIGTGWSGSPYQGSVMMRPVFGIADFYAGIDEKPVIAKRSELFTVFPNPSSDRLHIRVNQGNQQEKLDYTILDLFGRTIVENRIDGSGSIDIASLSNGVYFIKVVSGNNVGTVRFVKN